MADFMNMLMNARFQFHTVVLMYVQIIWDMASCRLLADVSDTFTASIFKSQGFPKGLILRLRER
jgi:hypothetical protein